MTVGNVPLLSVPRAPEVAPGLQEVTRQQTKFRDERVCLFQVGGSRCTWTTRLARGRSLKLGCKYIFENGQRAGPAMIVAK